MLPLVVAQTIASISCGLGVSATGYIWPFMTAASIFTAIGAGLLTTLKVNISVGRWIGYQIVYGVGMGLAAQTPLMVAQNVVALDDIAIASSLIMMMQAIGGYVNLSFITFSPPHLALTQIWWLICYCTRCPDLFSSRWSRPSLQTASPVTSRALVCLRDNSRVRWQEV